MRWRRTKEGDKETEKRKRDKKERDKNWRYSKTENNSKEIRKK